MDKTPGVRPRSGLWHWLDVASRHALPCVQTGLVMLVVPVLPDVPGHAQLQAAWVLASIFFWSVYRPGSAPALAVFILGLVLDLSTQGPLGVNGLVLLLTHAAALKCRRWLARHGFAVAWLVFGGVASLACVVSYLLTCLLFWQLPPIMQTALLLGVTVGLYPFLAYYFAMLHRGLAAPERAA